ncbi:S-locus-specific glycoprotein BS29-2 [Physcomitrium patens]|uniref:Bulb-type lectin domain-containing protein n=1 Tax=Physcomitrium patens TaxID=3218 RepID=A9T497_PHYPA|nr:S-locus-specific glycoprotein BS29-2-like [Physcomitrium patens]PNR30245.1 hypothetical protein PHYPA_026561 [Physcomitrium patens]|eukprot:XP_024360958.1 S-locus-specific glycoprotein BS29-2-like [Physcomitrella patens]
MGFKDPLVLLLLSCMFLGRTLEVRAQGTTTPTSPVLPGSSSAYGEWSVVESPEERIRKKTILVNGTFSFNLMITSHSRFPCVAAVQHSPSNLTVWVANFNGSFDGSTDGVGGNLNNQPLVCILRFSEKGGLVLTASDREIWSNSKDVLSKGYFSDLQLDSRGCLSISNRYVEEKDAIVWKSFDYPTDTLVSGQKLTVNSWMTAAQLDREYSSGDIFYMQVTPETVVLAHDFKINGTRRVPYRTFPSLPQHSSNGESIQYIAMWNGLDAYGENDNKLFLLSNGSIANLDNAQWDYARLGSDGGLRLKKYNSADTKLLYPESDDSCSLPGKCGSYGICTGNGKCSCPEGFDIITGSFSCQRAHALPANDINGCSGDRLVKVTGQTFLDILNDTTASDLKEWECEIRCKNSCNCTMALHVRRNATTDLGACFVNLDDAVQTIHQTGSKDDLQTLFLRISTTGLNPGFVPSPGSGTGSGGRPDAKSSRRSVAIAFAGVFGALVFLLFVGSAWWLYYLRKKLFEEAGREEFDLIPPQLGPPQFTYKQLVESPSNFA